MIDVYFIVGMIMIMKIVIIINKDDTITRISTIKIRKIKSEVTIILLVSL